LSEVEDSETHTLEIKEHSGYIKKINNPKYGEDDYEISHYLSTHSFYGDNKKLGEGGKYCSYRATTKMLQKYGFNVILRGDYGDEDEYEIGES